MFERIPVGLNISTRTPLAGSDEEDAMIDKICKIFQPALPLRGVTEPPVPGEMQLSFQPALPLRGVTTGEVGASSAVPFQPALPLRGVTP